MHSTSKSASSFATCWFTFVLILFLLESFVLFYVTAYRVYWASSMRVVALLTLLALPPVVLALTSYARTVLTNPGHVPAEWRREVESTDRVVAEPLRGWQPGMIEFCAKCNAVRPERAHHCTTCGTCILRMDHHCPWVANCVGAKNHRYFVLFLIWVSLSGVTFSAFYAPALVIVLADQFEDVSSVSWEYICILMAFLMAMSLSLACAVLAGSNVWSILRNYTSVESEYRGKNPYNVGSRSNWEQYFGRFSLGWFFPVDIAKHETCNYLEYPLRLSDGDSPLAGSPSSLVMLTVNRQASGAPMTPVAVV